jgi:plasmid stabilization system protein ParE
MKEYRLIVSPEAYQALDGFIEYIAVDQQSPLNAERWLQKAWSRLLTLKQFPHRCPPAPENESYRETIRMLIVDRCLFLYWVDEAAVAVRGSAISSWEPRTEVFVKHTVVVGAQRLLQYCLLLMRGFPRCLRC